MRPLFPGHSHPRLSPLHLFTAGLTRIERARGFLEGASLSENWLRENERRALILEAHHTTRIEGTRLALDQAEQLLQGKPVPRADPDDARELLNYKRAFEFVSEYLQHGAPITEGLVREIHKRLVDGVRGGAAARIMEQGGLTIQDFEDLCPEISRRTLQRDLKGMMDRGLIVAEGETHRLVYRLAPME